MPWPANYGGAIDAFYMLKTLHNKGYSITVHCFVYGNRTQQTEIENYSKTVFYYKRKPFWQFAFSKLPFIVASRMNAQLLKNLLLDKAPIIFHGAHTTGFVNLPTLQNRTKIIRTLNIETNYYNQLKNQSNNFFKNNYYTQEAQRLKVFEKNSFGNASIAAITLEDAIFFKQLYPNQSITIASPFHAFEKIECQEGLGEYCLYHGNLSVEENNLSANWLLQNVFNHIEIPIIISGNNASEQLKVAASKLKNCILIENPSTENMQSLIVNAQIHLLPTFQNTGFKLKLLNALFVGRHCVANAAMLTSTQLHPTCTVAETPAEWIAAINHLKGTTFTSSMIAERMIHLQPYINKNNIENLESLLS